MSDQSAPKQYAKRDIAELDKRGAYYHRHASAMTSEGLHGKSEIAAELGYRDMVIAQLRSERSERLQPETEQELLDLMPDSWVALIRAAITMRDRGLDNEDVQGTPEHAFLACAALSITNYCPTCKGNGSYNLCGNIETCGCGQRGL